MSKFVFPVEPLVGEPWVRLENGRDLSDWGKAENVRYNQFLRQAPKHALFMAAFGYLDANEIRGDYLEFGCHRVRTFRMALTEARKQLMDSMRFFAFDTFAGLPDQVDYEASGVANYVPGALCTTEEEFLAIVREHGIYVDRVRTIKGTFRNSLTPAQTRKLQGLGVKAAMVTVDCDVYESAVDVFAFLDPLLQPGSLIYLDDVFANYRGAPNQGVLAAFTEYATRSEWRFEMHWPVVGSFGRTYIAYK